MSSFTYHRWGSVCSVQLGLSQARACLALGVPCTGTDDAYFADDLPGNFVSVSV